MMKLSNVIYVRNLINKKSSETLSFAVAYKFLQFIKSTENAESFYNSKRKEIVENFALKDDNGSFIVDDKNCYTFNTESNDKMCGELLELANTEIEIPDTIKFKKSELENLNCTIEEVFYLDELIKD